MGLRDSERRAARARRDIETGLACQRGGQLKRAEALYRQALRQAPDNADAHQNLGNVLQVLGRLDEAMACHRRAAELSPDDPLVHLRLSDAQFCSGDPHASEATCRRAVSLDPTSGKAWTALGQILRTLGRFDEARSCLRHALELDPELPAAHAGLAILGQAVGTEDELRRLRALMSRSDHSVQTRSDAGFALGMLLDNADRYDEAFPCFARANDLYRGMLASAGQAHDRTAVRQHVDGLIQACTAEFFSCVENEGNPSDAPVFIVGMPRSGTSLVEHIAATHSRVTGAGELPNIGLIVHALRRHGQGRRADDLDPNLGRRLADGYVARLAALGKGAARVIDKMPDNILHLGAVSVLFPRARVIFCRRDLRDVCLSCYFCRFDQPQPWAYDLEDCGSRALEIERLAEHWRRVLPLRTLTIDYEALVADLEGESRRLIEFLGLDWEPACLDFHKTERPVLTASGWQVRQPIYNRSVGRWRKYERHLAPLLAVLAQRGNKTESTVDADPARQAASSII